MKVLKALGPQRLEVVEGEDPEAGEGEVLVEVKACGICGSDKWYWHVEKPTDYVAGHEVAGRVAVVGDKVQKLKVGDRVAVNNVTGCGECPDCRAGAFVRCPHGITHMGCGFSEKVVVPEENCLMLDDNLSYEEGSLIFDNWGTPFAAVERAKVKEGDTVVVSGCGPIGLAAISLCKVFGAEVIAIDPVEARRQAALRMGAVEALSPDEHAVSRIKELAGGIGANIFLECSGKSQAYTTAFAALRVGGTLVSIGEGAKFEMHPSEMMINKHLNFLGTLYSTMEQGRKVQDLMVKGLIKPLSIVSNTFELEELPQVFGDIVECKGNILKTILVIPGVK